jgi:hypothetical protein
MDITSRAFRFILAAFFAGFIGCTKPRGNNSGTGSTPNASSNPAANNSGTAGNHTGSSSGQEFISDLNGVIMYFVNSYSLSWDVVLSPDGRQS